MAERGGQEGNDNAHRGAVYRRALKRALAIAANDAGKVPDYEEGLLLVAQSHVAKALSGDVMAADKIADRFDGKPSQTTVIAGDGDNPLVISEVARKIIE